jgi:hypothetical protein
MKFFGTAIIFVCLMLAATIIHAQAQSVSSNRAMRGEPPFVGGYDPVHMCKVSTIPAARAKFCAEARQRRVIIRRARSY